MKSLESDPSLSSIFIGVMSETAKFDIREKFMMNLKLPSGFIMIDKKTTGFMEDLQKVLDINGAKGRRQYLRLDTKEMSEVSAYLTFDQKLFTVDVNDISSVGFAVKFSPNLQNVFKKNTLINNICLSLEKRSFVCSCIVFNVMVLQNGSHVAVLMLTNQNPKEIKNSIRSFIFEKLDRDMAEVIKISDSDNIHYRDSGEFDKLTAVRTEAADNSKVNAGDGGYHSSMDDIGDVEDLEEI